MAWPIVYNFLFTGFVGHVIHLCIVSAFSFFGTTNSSSLVPLKQIFKEPPAMCESCIIAKVDTSYDVSLSQLRLLSEKNSEYRIQLKHQRQCGNFHAIALHWFRMTASKKVRRGTENCTGKENLVYKYTCRKLLSAYMHKKRPWHTSIAFHTMKLINAQFLSKPAQVTLRAMIDQPVKILLMSVSFRRENLKKKKEK